LVVETLFFFSDETLRRCDDM